MWKPKIMMMQSLTNIMSPGIVYRQPGRSEEGYGKKSVSNMYHGGTIFRDATASEFFLRAFLRRGIGKL
jgi:hypothetical protein